MNLKKLISLNLLFCILLLVANSVVAEVIWENGEPIYNQGSSGWHERYIIPKYSPLRAQDFILNDAYKLNQVLFHTASYTRDTEGPLLTLEYWFFEDDAGDIGTLLYHDIINFSEVITGEVLILGTLEFITYEYIAALPSLNFSSGHYWMAVRVGPDHQGPYPEEPQSAEAFWANSGGSTTTGDYLYGWDSYNQAFENDDDWTKIILYGTGSFAFTLSGELIGGSEPVPGPDPKPFPWAMFLPAIIGTADKN